VAVPIGCFCCFLAGVGPLLPWRGASLKSIRRNFVLPVIALWAYGAVCLAAGVRPWKDGAI
jgi:cytochrome c-type biogenesis protein CcmF